MQFSLPTGSLMTSTEGGQSSLEGDFISATAMDRSVSDKRALEAYYPMDVPTDHEAYEYPLVRTPFWSFLLVTEARLSTKGNPEVTLHPHNLDV